MTQEIKKAIESAEQEIQEKEIAQLKGIIKDLLQKKADKEEDKREIEKEISVIKQTIDDFKAGRLDKVKELQEKDFRASKLLPFKIVIINQPVYTQPWNWSYQVVPSYNTPLCTSGFVSVSSGTNTDYYGTSLTAGVTETCTIAGVSNSCGASGNNYATFTSGTYALGNGRIINL